MLTRGIVKDIFQPIVMERKSKYAGAARQVKHSNELEHARKLYSYDVVSLDVT